MSILSTMAFTLFIPVLVLRGLIPAAAVRPVGPVGVAQMAGQAAQQEAQRIGAENQQKQVFETVQAYDKRAVDLGVTQEELKVAADTLKPYNLDPNVTWFVLQAENGPLITKYLAQNPQEIDGLRGLNPMQAAVKLTNDIGPKAVAAGKGKPPPPPPVAGLDGGGAPPGEEGPPGATYE